MSGPISRRASGLSGAALLLVLAACDAGAPLAVGDSPSESRGGHSTTVHSGSVHLGPNGHHYEVVQVSLSFRRATAAAEERILDGRPGRLVTITSAEEAEFVASLLQSQGFYWTGGHWEAGAWTWGSGEPVSYTNWLDGTPPDSYLRNSAIFVISDPGASGHGQWWRASFSYKPTGFIVEY